MITWCLSPGSSPSISSLSTSKRRINPGALYHYNPVETYVDAVATYAAAIRRDPRLYYAMYCWQGYVFTTRSHRRITGPGL